MYDICQFDAICIHFILGCKFLSWCDTTRDNALISPATEKTYHRSRSTGPILVKRQVVRNSHVILPFCLIKCAFLRWSQLIFPAQSVNCCLWLVVSVHWLLYHSSRINFSWMILALSAFIFGNLALWCVNGTHTAR